MQDGWLRGAAFACVVALGTMGCGDDSTDAAGGTGGGGAAGNGGTGGVMMLDPDRFPWTFTISLVEVKAVSAGDVFDIDEWCDADNRGEFFVRYRVSPPGDEGPATLLNLELDAVGPTDTRLYDDTLQRTFTIASANETASISSTNSFEDDGFLGDDNLSDFVVSLPNIPPSLIDFTDVGCSEYDYEGSIGRNDCPSGCIITATNRAKNLCYLETTWCYRNVSPPDR